MTPFIELFSEVICKLEQGSIEYMIVGSVASMIYGEARLTNDIDIVINVGPELGLKLPSLFPSSKYYVPPVSIVSQELVNCGQFNVLHTASGLKIDFVIRKKSPHAVAEFSRRTRQPLLPGLEAWIASPEDIILKKLLFYREGLSEKHLTDCRGILANSPVDRSYLENWVKTLGLAEEWQKLL